MQLAYISDVEVLLHGIQLFAFRGELERERERERKKRSRGE